MKFLLIALICALPLAALAADSIHKEPWGKADGKDVFLFTLRNKNGMEVAITNYGARVVSLKVPDRNGKIADVVLGFDSLQGYLGDNTTNPYFGAIVGRYANRIAKGRFTLDGHTYQLAINDPPNSLHGGTRGFDRRVWQESGKESGQSLRLRYVSKDGEEGYPGDLDVTVTYTLTDKNELRINLSATTDKDTVLNLANHSYFNLAGQGEGDVLGHEVTIHATRFTPVDSTLIPTGELKPVAGTPFDFQKPHAIGERIGQKNTQLKYGRGYDHNFVLDGAAGRLRVAARVVEPKSGRVLQVSTDQPGLQFYTGNFLDGTIHGKGGKLYPARGAFCMETQHFPDSPNRPEFPSTELKPGQQYQTVTIFRFSAR